MRHADSSFRLISAVLLLLGGQTGIAFAQQAADTTAAAGSDGTLSLWNIIGQAGGFQYPIFGILVIGLFLILMKVYELFRDQWASSQLRDASTEEMGMEELVQLVDDQQQSMLAELQATLLNVYQTTRDAGTLHEEMANFIQFQRERFDTFERRINFLADTAGAVGLMGTVWAMFTLFSGGNIDDKQVILGGMGIALISTLLGLVVSITLNLIATEVYSYFDSRIDRIEDEGDQLRFRLMELSPSENGAATEPAVSAAAPEAQAAPVSHSAPAPEAESSPSGEPEAPAPTAGGGAPTEAPAKPRPDHLELASIPKEGVVDSMLSNVQLRAAAEDGTPVPDVPVRVRVGQNAGSLNGGKSEVTLRTDDDGAVDFDWKLPETSGSCVAEASISSADADEASRTLSVQAQPEVPSQYNKEGDNQGAQGGKELPDPLSVTLFDEYRNPVPEQPVQFKVTSGQGTFSNGSQEVEVKTDEDGRAEASFAVGSEPGLNVVEASVGGETVRFQLMTLGQ